LDGTITGYNVWLNMNFSAAPSTITLGTQVLIGDTITTLSVACTLSDWPSSGTVLIDSEAFTYTGKSGRTLTGVTRASKNTVAATHTAGTTIYLVQHDIFITYGDGTLTAPATNDDYKPALELDHSTNTSWVYENFGDDNGLRAGAWTLYTNHGNVTRYTANHATNATPWSEAGMQVIAHKYGEGAWRLYNPCGITNADISNGEYYGQANLDDGEIEIESSTNGCNWSEDFEMDLTCDATWRAWSNATTLKSGAKHVRVVGEIRSYGCGHGTEYLNVEFSDATITLNSSYTPSITLGSEIGSGTTFAPTITNTTTGDAITLSYLLGVNQRMTVDTANKTITLSDGSSHLEAITLDQTRREWLRLAAGVNVLTFSDVGTAKLEVEVEWDRRYFE
jgi:hypothetical protein